MSGAHEQGRRRRPPRTFVISTHLRVQDRLDGTIRLRRGFMCQEPAEGRSRGGDWLWVKVLDSGLVVKVERRFLLDVPSEFSGLLEPVSDPDARLKLLNNPIILQQLVALQADAPLWVQRGQQDELLEAELKYVGPLTRGSSSVFFGVQLKGSAAGKGVSNGSFRGQRLFTCPDACALFLPPLAPVFLPQTAESAPIAAQVQTQVRRSASAPLLHVGQRVCFPLEDTLYGGEVLYYGEVRFCGVLASRSSSGTYVGVLLDAPVGNWDGLHQGEKLCHIPSVLYGLLLPITSVSSVSPETTSQRHTPPQQRPKPILKPAPFPDTKPAATSPPAFAPKLAIMPPSKPAPKPPPLPPPKPALKPLPPPLPLPKLRSPTSPTVTEQLQHTNGVHGPASPLPYPDPPDAVGEDGEALEVGSMVEVNDPPIFGVICWIGRISGIHEPVAGIELDQELSAGTDGSYLGERHFRCPANKGLFVKLRNCRRDSRFPAPETPINQVERCNSIAFAEWGSERVEEDTPPVDGDEARERYQGWKRGIQGHLNSCYLDATLFSLFSVCSSADWILFWPCDIDPTSCQAQDLLRCEVVNPLRRFGYVCASKTMALRRLLEAADRNTGFTSQEKDPEEFLNRLFQLLRVEPLLKIRSMTQQPQECHLYQLFPPAIPPSPPSPHSPRMRVAGVQTLLESSFLNAGLKFVEAPSCLLLLMPRFGKDFKMFDAIFPTLSLDITDLLDDTLRQCSICQAVAQWECLQCYTDVDITPGRLKQFCPTCNTQVHSHRKRTSHSPVKVGVPAGPWPSSLHCARQTMSLFAVTSIETSHYVSFIRHGPLPTDWMFFDSMADREGGENGFNVPRVMACPEVGRYLGLSEEELSRVDPASLREPARRLLCDSYMCLYHSPELSLYK
ncbi:putative ubiquitin carboxyl-terminal hydrolase CYLD-like [Scophthalmus maximus]|uniref:ubiquitinyl hydrolase 1 n=1 Tax=Scophthalmus maximus TaxID=52904 RepID=A0A2U9B034_SCOMX|nr:putative ubiquitin carboxyl-terminal hydrolase CYLD-like [Scophthalmus maximus]